MKGTPSPSKEYLRSAVLTASPEQLVLMLYDGAIRFTSRGREGILAKDREAAFEALDRAQLIVLELSGGIRREANPEIADQMASLYSFVYRRLVEANIYQDVSAVDDGLRVLRYQRETWQLLMQKLQQEQGASQKDATAPQIASQEERPSAFVAEG
jgi:flagellar secretion chaperone FliS